MSKLDEESCQNLQKGTMPCYTRPDAASPRTYAATETGLVVHGGLQGIGGCSVSASDYMLMISSQASRSVTAENLQVV